ncbi:MAG: CopG family transcriptional regulator [Magnetococcales bacterium]|nr:CopG family transcriptional regulator [Magnetococcales bacterium]
MDTTISALETRIPDHLWQQAQFLVTNGWAKNIDELVAEALSRYLESHDESIAERFVHEDVEWGLNGRD